MQTESFCDRDGFIWMDGALVPWREAQIHLLTHALHYASSVFEGERAYGGRIFRSRDHTERLLNSARIMDMNIPYNAEEIEAAKGQVLRANGRRDTYLRVIAWRGSEAMGPSGLRCKTHLGIASWNFGAYYGAAREQGARLILSKWRRPPPDSAPCHAKAGGLYMICTLSKNEAERQGATDALMLDFRGLVAEATSANVFFVKGDSVHTPTPDVFLNGLTRQTVMSLLARRKVQVIERPIEPEEIATFDQCFLTGTAAEITPVACIGEKSFAPGGLVSMIAQDYHAHVHHAHPHHAHHARICAREDMPAQRDAAHGGNVRREVARGERAGHDLASRAHDR